MVRLSTAALGQLALAAATDNGAAPTPPMGFRTWNAYHGDVDDALIRSLVDALASRKRLVDGQPTSLADLGYGRLGIDDGWQACGTGWKGSFHAQDGTPLVNKTKFPDLKSMVDYGHGQGVKMGWYNINCICMDTYTVQRDSDSSWASRVYEAEVQLIMDAGFDGLKIDNCGDDQGIGFQMMVDLVNKSGHPLLIENSNQGHSGNPRGLPTDATKECPGNFFRSGGDIGPDYGNVMDKLQRTIPFQDLDAPISRPDCWAYPDMLEVGNFEGADAAVQARSHFGAWCIVSSPLILGLDLTDDSALGDIWSVITNREAIAVNQAWAGHPGRLITDGGAHQIWAKKLANGAQAVLVVNRQGSTLSGIDVDLEGLDLSGSCTARDVWARKDLSPVSGTWSIKTLAPYDSMFVVLTPSGPAPPPAPPAPSPPTPTGSFVTLYDKRSSSTLHLIPDDFEANTRSGRQGILAWDACTGATFENGSPVWSSDEGSNIAGFEINGDFVLRGATMCGKTWDYQDLDISSAHTTDEGRVDFGELVYLEIQAASVV